MSKFCNFKNRLKFPSRGPFESFFCLRYNYFACENCVFAVDYVLFKAFFASS